MSDHYTSAKTSVEIGPLRRKDFRKIMDEICEEYTDFPLCVKLKEEPVHGGLYSKFTVIVKGKPDEVEEMAVALDKHLFLFQICTHERLHIN